MKGTCTRCSCNTFVKECKSCGKFFCHKCYDEHENNGNEIITIDDIKIKQKC